MENEITNYFNETVPTQVNLSELPFIIEGQFDKITDLGNKVVEATNYAKKAQEAASTANKKSAGFGHKKEAIEGLQEATGRLAESQVSLADAQRLSFDYQKELGKIAKYLYCLGVSSIAANRTVLRELELRLSGASADTLSNLAKQEIENVMHQLKAQEDIMCKQAELTGIVHQHDVQLSSIDEAVQFQDSKLTKQAEKDAEHDELIAHNKEIIEKQEREIGEQSQKDAEHDELIAYNRDNIERLVDKLYVQDEHIICIDKQIQEIVEENQQLKLQAQNLITKVQSSNDEIQNRLNKKASVVFSAISFATAIIGVAAAIISFFI